MKSISKLISLMALVLSVTGPTTAFANAFSTNCYGLTQDQRQVHLQVTFPLGKQDPYLKIDDKDEMMEQLDDDFKLYSSHDNNFILRLPEIILTESKYGSISLECH